MSTCTERITDLLSWDLGISLDFFFWLITLWVYQTYFHFSFFVCRKCVFQRRWVRFDGESLTYYNNDKVGNGGKYGLKRLALPNLSLPCPADTPSTVTLAKSASFLCTASSWAKFLSVPFVLSAFSLSSLLAWQSKEWGQGQSDITPRMMGQHSLCPPSHTVKYIDVGTWPVLWERKMERGSLPQHFSVPFSSLSLSFYSPYILNFA